MLSFGLHGEVSDFETHKKKSIDQMMLNYRG